MPKVNAKANENKRLIEDRAAKLISSFDRSELRRQSEDIIKLIRKSDQRPTRIIVLGAAGSNKTSLSHELSVLTNLPAFDLDEYVEIGDNLSPDYPKRLRAGWYNLWPEVPNSTGWIIEHVEAGHPDFVAMMKPRFAVLLSPGIDHLKSVAAARTAVSGDDRGDRRERRAMETAIRSAKHFHDLSGMVIGKGTGWTLKEIR